jgi:hypothetical protein
VPPFARWIVGGATARVPHRTTLGKRTTAPAPVDYRPGRRRTTAPAPAGYHPGTAPNSSVDPNPSSAPASAVPLARASAATAAATAGATSRLNTDGMM